MREIEELLLRMDSLIAALLKLSRLDAGVVTFQKTSLNLAELVAASIRPFSVSLDLHEVQVETAISPNITIYGDRIWLSEALQNLLRNCIESIGEKGTIAINGTDNPLFTEISIHDSGKGFEPAEISRLFERFYRGKNTSTTGFGIGLSLSKAIIHRQGGTITAKNHPNGGALFIIRFPK